MIKMESEKMKVALFTHYWKTSKGGGINTYILELVNHLENKFDIDVIYTFGDDENNFKVSPYRAISFISSTLRLIKIKPDVIHVNESFDFLASAIAYNSLFKKSKIIYTFHTEPIHCIPTIHKLKKFVKYKLYKFMLSYCYCVTFVSKSLEEKIRQAMNLDQTINSKITYAGVGKKYISNEEKKMFRIKHGLNENDIIILALGMLALKPKAEGTKILISAFEILLTKYTNIKLVITRDGKYLDEIHRYVDQKCLNEHIVFTGDINNPLTAVATTDIFCQITLAEGGVSVSLLEAMSMEKPIVASSAGGIPEAIEHGINGFLTDNNPELLASYISKLLDDNELSLYLGRNALSTVNEKFRWNMAANAFEDLYTVNGR